MKSILTLAAASLLALPSLLQAEDAPKPYPLQTCLISGEKLGGMGQPVTYVYEGQEYKFCCKSCLKKFEADPAKYAKELSQSK